MEFKYKECPRCKTRTGLTADKCLTCGRVFRTKFAAGQIGGAANKSQKSSPNPLVCESRFRRIAIGSTLGIAVIVMTIGFLIAGNVFAHRSASNTENAGGNFVSPALTYLSPPKANGAVNVAPDNSSGDPSLTPVMRQPLCLFISMSGQHVVPVAKDDVKYCYDFEEYAGSTIIHGNSETEVFNDDPFSQNELLHAGKIFLVRELCKIKALSYDGKSVRIQILDGVHSGDRGIVPRYYLFPFGGSTPLFNEGPDAWMHTFRNSH